MAKFGLGQILNPTPSKINLWVRVYTVTAGIFLGWMVTNSIIGPHTQNNISSIVGLSLALVNGLAPLFGVEISGNQRVKASEVSAMDEIPKVYSAPNDSELNK